MSAKKNATGVGGELEKEKKEPIAGALQEKSAAALRAAREPLLAHPNAKYRDRDKDSATPVLFMGM